MWFNSWSNGNYSVTVSDNNNCQSSDEINVSFIICEGIEENKNSNAIELNFIAENNIVLISGLNSVHYENISLDLFNVVGQKIVSIQNIAASANYEFKLPDELLNGIYLIRVNIGEIQKTIRVIKT